MNHETDRKRRCLVAGLPAGPLSRKQVSRRHPHSSQTLRSLNHQVTFSRYALPSPPFLSSNFKRRKSDLYNFATISPITNKILNALHKKPRKWRTQNNNQGLYYCPKHARRIFLMRLGTLSVPSCLIMIIVYVI